VAYSGNKRGQETLSRRNKYQESQAQSEYHQAYYGSGQSSSLFSRGEPYQSPAYGSGPKGRSRFQDTSMMKKATMVSKTTSKKRTTTARKWMQHPCKSTASKTMRAQGDLNQPTSTSNSSARSSKTCSRRTPSHQARLPSRTPTPRAATRTHMRRRVMLTRVKRTTLWTSSSKSIIAASAAKSTK